jgi:hypothetical protein
LVVHQPWFYSNLHPEIPVRPADTAHAGPGIISDAGIGSDAGKVDFQSAGRRTKLGKVVVETGHVSAQVIRFFNEHYRLSGFGQLHRSRDACNPASYDQGLFSQGYVNSQEYCV